MAMLPLGREAVDSHIVSTCMCSTAAPRALDQMTTADPSGIPVGILELL